MTTEQLAAELLAISEEAQRQRWLEGHHAQITRALIATLRVEATRSSYHNPPRALQIATIAREAAHISADPLAMPEALWAEGNISAFTGDFEASLAAYQSAAASFAAQGETESVACLQNNCLWPLINLGRQEEALALAETARQGLVATGHSQSAYLALLEMNVGVAYRQTGRYETALAAYERSRTIFVRLDNRLQVARIDINRAKILLKMERFETAKGILETTRSVLVELDAAPEVARVDFLLGHLAFGCGHYWEALDTYDRAREAFMALDNDLEVASADYYRSQVYLTINLLPEAAELASHAWEAFAKRGMVRYASLAMARQAAAARGLGDTAKALSLFSQARANLEARGETLEVALLDLQRVGLSLQDGQWDSATDAARSAAEVFQQLGLDIHLGQAWLALADSLLAQKQDDQAARLYASVQQIAAHNLPASLLYRAHYGLGRVAEARGEYEIADQHYQTAVTYLETIHRDLRIDEFQASFRDDKLDLYQSIVRIALRRGDTNTAFEFVERAKSSTLLDLLAHGLDTLTSEDTKDDLLERIQNLREKWYWNSLQLEGHIPGEDDHPTRSIDVTLSTSLHDIEFQLSEAWRQLHLRRAQSPTTDPGRTEQASQLHWQSWTSESTAAVGPQRRLSLAALQTCLPSTTALVEYYAVDGKMLVFLICASQTEVIDLHATIQEVEEQIAAWRFDLDSMRLMLPSLSSREIPLLEADSRLLLQHLYQNLIFPLAPFLCNYQHLIIVPHQSLHYLPFAALHDGQQYMVDRFEISYLLRANSLLAQMPTFSDQPFPDGVRDLYPPLIIAHSDHGRLPHAEEEARCVGEALPGARIFVENEATEAQLRRYGPTCGLLHLATHGRFRADNPFFSWLNLAGTRLTVRDIYSLHLPHTSLVTISACETGLGTMRGGELLGLTQALSAAGARSSLLSLWAVEDTSTAALMTTFYRNLAKGGTAGAALQAAQQQMRQRYPHPYYWAGFVLIGESRKLMSEKRPV